MANDDWTTSRHYSVDPIREIPPSLLNSADIVRYAALGCLVHPFRNEIGFLNPATYTISLLGELYWWESEGKGLRRLKQSIARGDDVTLRANSISYLLTEEEFRLPQYIAARFNLHIRYVHKGILLGTGPLIDPGFVGRLLVPLHNLTDNDYHEKGGDKLLWAEFTKLSGHTYWNRPIDQQSAPRPDELVGFDDNKLGLDADQYFAKAGVSAKPGVLSAFKGALDDSRRQAAVSRAASEGARRDALQAANKSERIALLGALGVASGIVALLLAAWQLWQANSDMASRVHDRLDRIERQVRLLPPSESNAATQDDGERLRRGGGATKPERWRSRRVR